MVKASRVFTEVRVVRVLVLDSWSRSVKQCLELFSDLKSKVATKGYRASKAAKDEDT